MSIEVMSLVLKRKLGSATRKVVMLAMADAANDDGTGIWKSADSVAAECDLSKRTVLRVWKELEESGLIQRTGTRSVRGGEVIVWGIKIDIVSDLERSKPARVSPDDNLSPSDTDGNDPVTLTTESGDRLSPKPLINHPTDTNVSDTREENSKPPSKPKPKSAPRGSQRGKRISDNWSPTPEDYAYASKLGLQPQEINDEAIEFRDYWRNIPGHKGVKLNWSLTWQRRCRDVVNKGWGVRSASNYSRGTTTSGSSFSRVAAEMAGRDPIRPKSQSWNDGSPIEGEFVVTEPYAGDG